MAIITDLNCNLREAVKVKYLDGNLFSQDVYGNAIRVIVMDGDEPATLSGTVSGIAVRADGGSVDISDSRIDGTRCRRNIRRAAKTNSLHRSSALGHRSDTNRGLE